MFEEEKIPELLPFDLFEGEELDVKYNGEEQKLTRDQVRTLAQKGMNYDKILKDRDQLAAVMDTLAAAEGVTRSEFITKNSGGDLDSLRWKALLGKYPDLDSDCIPKEVYLAVSEGKSPIEAYQDRLIEDLTLRLKAGENLRENMEKAAGSLFSAGESPKDDFLQGFLGKKY